MYFLLQYAVENILRPVEQYVRQVFRRNIAVVKRVNGWLQYKQEDKSNWMWQLLSWKVTLNADSII